MTAEEDLMKEILVQVHEISAISRHSYNEVAIPFRKLLGFEQLTISDNIELNPFASHGSVGLDEASQLFQVLPAC